MNTQAAGQRWSADDYARNGRFVADLAAPLLGWLAPQVGERVLDLGCGDGALSEKITASGADVLGADASPELVAAARARGVNAEIVDGHALGFESEFDAVFSNAALHWMKRDPSAVIVGVFRALKPGGRFVAEMGGDGNVANIRGALYDAARRRGLDAEALDPWYFPTMDEYRGRLEAAGFNLQCIERYERLTSLPGDVAAWLKTFAQSFLQRVATDQQDAMIDEVQSALRSRLADAAGRWTADYIRLRFIAIKTP